jgi:uncharacterized protein DUF5672
MTASTTPSCAIVVPVYQDTFSSDDELSFRHLYHYLSDYPIVFAVPEGLEVDRRCTTVQSFDPEYFKSRDGYSALLLSRGFYNAFRAYDYILIYQLDCLAFSSNLEAWLQLGYDYIGAPWFNDLSRPEEGFSRVGNGGLSLRKVSSFLSVIDSSKYIDDRPGLFSEFMKTHLPDIEQMGMTQAWRKKLAVLQAVRVGSEKYRSGYSLNEDHFWSDRASLFYRDFNIAPSEISTRFAFEQHPEFCYEALGQQLPFGTHAWKKWGATFWQQFLLAED